MLNSTKLVALVNSLAAITVDALEELEPGDAKDAVSTLILKLQTYNPADKPSVPHFVEDAVNAIEAIADVSDKSVDQKGDTIVHEVGDFIKAVAGGKFNPITAISLLIKAKRYNALLPKA